MKTKIESKLLSESHKKLSTMFTVLHVVMRMRSQHQYLSKLNVLTMICRLFPKALYGIDISGRKSQTES